MLQGDTIDKGWKAIDKNLGKARSKVLESTKEKIEKIKKGERDLYF